MRKSNEWNTQDGKKPAVYVVDVTEIPFAPVQPVLTAPSSSSVSPPNSLLNQSQSLQHKKYK